MAAVCLGPEQRCVYPFCICGSMHVGGVQARCITNNMLALHMHMHMHWACSSRY